MTLNSNIEGDAYGSISGAGSYKAGEKVPLTASANIGYSFLGWYLGAELLSEEESYEYSMPAGSISITASFQKWAAGEVVEYGKYPQACLNDPLEEASTLPKGIESATDTDNDGYVEFNGKEYLVTKGSGNSSHVYDGSEATPEASIVYLTDVTYYFEVSPIQWKLNSDGTLICQDIIDASIFYTSHDGTRTIGETTIYPNNYEYSSIRDYLNGSEGFLGKAFTSKQQQDIPSVTVDNSASTAYGSSNPYACNNTEDKLFLLSYKDCINTDYGFKGSVSTDAARAKKYTDYAVYKGLNHVYLTTGTGYWWTRSPSFNGSSSASLFLQAGDLGLAYYVDYAHGLVPAFRISL